MPLNAPETGGRFRVWVDVGKGKGDELAWDRKVRLDVFTSLTELSFGIRHPSMGKIVAKLMAQLIV